MSIEEAIFVLIPPDLVGDLSDLHARAEAALRRSSKLPPGQTREIARFEALSTQIERRALSLALADPRAVVAAGPVPRLGSSLLTRDIIAGQGDLPHRACELLQAGATLVVVGRPHRPGPTAVIESGQGPRPPAEAWRATRPGKRWAEAERFEASMTAALAQGAGKAAINPLAVSNQVLTETLRRFVQAEAGLPRVEVAVEYRDGSIADPFPLRALAFGASAPAHWPVLKLTLLSLRHVEMDEVVRGAWFRNTRISRNSPAGLIDADAFAMSIKQLAQLRARGPHVIEMHQTGFQPAVMGFYRAVVHALIDHPGSICVVPKFFGGERFKDGEPWMTA